tara:strand:- start:20800 stop:20955 length:156 start_codon:yes stop_codon:yes gene_type:complete
MSALIVFPLVLLSSLIQAAVGWPRMAAFSGFVAGWWFPDFLRALLHIGATP